MPTTYAVPNGRTEMAATLWTGNGTSQTINNASNGVSFQPDFVWVKERSAVRTHCLTDSVRGFTKYLFSDTTGGEETYSTLVTSVNSNGFNLGASVAVNDSGQTYVGWQWKANGTGVSNTAGSISSTVSANTTSGFSIVTYTGNGTGGATVGHGLGVAPAFIVIKSRSTAGTDWLTLSTSAGLTGDTSFGYPEYYMLALNSNAARQNYSADLILNPTATTFALGSGGSGYSNGSGQTYVAYCFAPIAGFSASGSYTGNGSTDGPFVYTGFKPSFILWKRIDTSGFEWILQDTARQTYNAAPNNAYNLAPNRNVEENNSAILGGPANANNIDWLSNGFKIRYNNANCNASGGTYIYIAFASNPFKYANAQ